MMDRIRDRMHLTGIFRATIVLKHYRAFEMPQGVKFNAWLNRLVEHPAFKNTCSTEQLYLDSYERQASLRSFVLVCVTDLIYT